MRLRAWVLVDCGRSATQRAVDAGLDLTAVVAVITHHHSDHISDLATFATTRWTAGASRAVGGLAAQTLPAQLVLTHLIPAPRHDADELAYVNEVRAGGLEGNVIVARDLLRVAIDGPRRPLGGGTAGPAT